MDTKDKRIAELRQRIAELEALLQAALKENRQLKAEIAALKKNSTNSSKPPSSDIVKPPKNKNKQKKKRKHGAQPGHQQHLRKPIAPELIDDIIKLELDSCPDCGSPLDLADIEPKISQQLVRKLPMSSLRPVAGIH